MYVHTPEERHVENDVLLLASLVSLSSYLCEEDLELSIRKMNSSEQRTNQGWPPDNVYRERDTEKTVFRTVQE